MAPDTAIAPDQGLTPDSATPVGTGQLLITEFLADPDAVTDTKGEWFELYNPGTKSVDLKGWTLKDDGSNKHVIASSLVIGPKAYLVLGRNSQSTTNGGVTLDYEYSSFTLSNSEDEIELRDPSGQLVDRVPWDIKWLVFSKYSTALKSLTLDNTKKENWCISASAWTGSAGDYGSPGAPSNCAPLVSTGVCTHKTVASLQFASHLYAKILSKWKEITIRDGHLTTFKAGDWARFFFLGPNFTLEAKITVARHTTYGGITKQEYQDDGFKTQAEMLAKLQTYYPKITLASPATIYRWTDTTLCDWP